MPYVLCSQVTGIHDIDQLVSRFIKIEDENFAQFNYVNEVNTETEALQEETRERKADMADMEKTSTQIDKRRREILSQLEVRFSEVCSKRQKIQEQYKQAKKILEQVKPKIDHLFKSVKCNRSAVTDLLGNTAGLTEDNVMSFLGIIEQRTNELLQVHCIQKLKYGLEDANKHLMIADTMFPVAAERYPPLSIKPPSIADDDDIGGPIIDLTDSRPVSFKEAKALVNKGVVCLREVTKDSKKQVRSTV
jgi:flagellar motor protein MotB